MNMSLLLFCDVVESFTIFPPRDGRSVPRGHEKSQLSTYVPVIAHAFHSNEEEDQNLPYHHWSMDLPHCNDNRCIRFDGRHG